MPRFAGACNASATTKDSNISFRLLPRLNLRDRLEEMVTAEVLVPRSFCHYIHSLLLDCHSQHKKYRAWLERSDPEDLTLDKPGAMLLVSCQCSAQRAGYAAIIEPPNSVPH